MSVYSDLVADVLTITKRPDREDLIKLGIRMATLKAHQSDFFPKDLFETGLQFIPPFSNLQSFEYRALIPRWRAFKYLRKFDYTTPPGAAGKLFKFIQPEELLNRDFSYEEEDVCYLAGSMIEIRSSTKDQYMLHGCYVNPDVTETSYKSWIAEEHPMAIIAGADAYVFKQTGYSEQASDMNVEVADQFQLLKMEILGEGY